MEREERVCVREGLSTILSTPMVQYGKKRDWTMTAIATIATMDNEEGVCVDRRARYDLHDHCPRLPRKQGRRYALLQVSFESYSLILGRCRGRL